MEVPAVSQQQCTASYLELTGALTVQLDALDVFNLTVARCNHTLTFGFSESPRICSEVDLPQPEGHMIEVNSPSSIVRSTLSSAVVSMSSVRKSFAKPSILMIIALSPAAISNKHLCTLITPILNRCRDLASVTKKLEFFGSSGAPPWQHPPGG